MSYQSYERSYVSYNENAYQSYAEGRETQVSERGTDTQVSEHEIDTQVPVRGIDTQVSEHGGDTQVPERGGQTQISQYDGRQTQISQYGRQTQGPEHGRQTQIPERGRHTQIPEHGRQTQISQRGKETQAFEHNPTQGDRVVDPPYLNPSTTLTLDDVIQQQEEPNFATPAIPVRYTQKRQRTEDHPEEHSKQRREQRPEKRYESMSQFSQSGQQPTTSGNKKLYRALNLTYYILKGQVENKLSVIPNKSYEEKYKEWMEAVADSNMDVKSTLNFIIHSAQEYRDSFDVNRMNEEPRENGFEFAADVLIHGKSYSEVNTSASSSKTSISPGKKVSPTQKKSPEANKSGKKHKCKVCKEKFVIDYEDQRICNEDYCQARKCKHCNADRLISNKTTGKCQKCYKGE